ncbi:zinc carboxypeptidase [Pontibacter mucosus]|uniref:Zinc carboxypeptidase n=1 Tax=Pontibacter mucosus TaxID=1649266 RepID=A0A2T5YQM4_9BACT|nr:M14 metallopeptidase family protein [Pontibacter mucosus]PTX21576.1 zinc carboxypeptidase [Pontibacter mucosus]
MRKPFTLILLFMSFLHVLAQSQSATQVAQQAFDQHATYKEPSLQHRRFKHQDIVPLLEQLRQNPLFEVQVVGQSVEQRDIYLVKAGSGKTKVMLWSQMHGDEPTATMALFDLFNFLQQSDALNPLRQQLLENVTLYFVPMLNPDGAERYRRHNALEIDLNRDALRLQSPEARLLKSLRDSLNPEFGFNLHDQSRYYTAGSSPKPATISFLAPAFDHAQTVNHVRERAMRTIVGMNEALQQLVPGHVAKYSDEFEPRAFGDNIQKWGTSVILIESGGYPNDPEKQHIRRLNFASILSALHLISENGYTAYALDDYYKIPQNERNLYDLVLRNVRFHRGGHDVLLDVGVFRDEEDAPVGKGFYHRSSVAQVGDMSIFHGYEEIDASGLRLEPGKIYDKPFKSIADLKPRRARSLLAKGYTTVQVQQLPESINPLELPLNVVSTSSKVDHDLNLNGDANFILSDEKGKLRYAVVNGFVYDLSAEKPELFHGLVL